MNTGSQPALSWKPREHPSVAPAQETTVDELFYALGPQPARAFGSSSSPLGGVAASVAATSEAPILIVDDDLLDDATSIDPRVAADRPDVGPRPRSKAFDVASVLRLWPTPATLESHSGWHGSLRVVLLC